MTVKVSKPAINVREELADLRKPSGVAGEAMLRAETPQEQQALIGVGGRRNAIINGGFDVWQRGTSQTLLAGTRYSADRWTGYSSVDGRVHSQDTTSALSIGFKNCAKFITGTANPSFYQRVEDVRTFAGQTVTLSFWMKASKRHTLYTQSLQQNFGSGGSNSVTNSLPELGEVTTDWKYFTATVDLPSVEGKTIGSNNYLLVYPSTLEASTTYWVTGFQLELGTIATPFEHRSYGEELAACQRYYEVAAQGGHIGGFTYYTTTNSYGAWRFRVEKRAAPTVSASGSTAVSVLSNGNAYQSTAIAFANVEPASVRVSVITSARTNGHGAWVNLNNGYFIADAEL